MQDPAANQRETKPSRLFDRRRFLRLAGKAALIAAGPTAYAKWIEPDQLVVANVDVALPGLPPAASGLRIGHISDLHCDDDHAVERTRRAVALLLAQKPDVVAITGDYVTLVNPRWVMACVDALAPLASVPGGAFAILGNHDWWSGNQDRITRELHAAGITVLRNEARPVKLARAKDVWMVGLDDRWMKKHDAARAAANVPKDAARILLVHEPDYADEAPPGFLLQLSGHAHGGQVRIPGLPPLIVPPYSRRYPEGLRQGRRHIVYTTRGVGMVRPRLRLFCRPEVALLRLVTAPILEPK
jgi:predicted MPP superfamily phosphohydrolase